MKSYEKIFIIVILAFIPDTGICQKTIKRNSSQPKSQTTKIKKQSNNTYSRNKTIKHIGSHSTKTSSSKFSKSTLLENILSNMVYVEGGSFMMGSESDEALNWEKPIHEETVQSFQIGKYEITQKEWLSLMPQNPSYVVGEDYPVQGVSLENCNEFIAKLNELSGLTFRLPTEAEWEYAARGGNKSNGYIYSGSDNPDEIGWYGDNCNACIHSVGRKKPNELGIFDMSGNAYEWTCEKYSNNYKSPRKGPEFVIRGGSWLQDKNECRVSSRSFSSHNNEGINFGFRLVLDTQHSE